MRGLMWRGEVGAPRCRAILDMWRGLMADELRGPIEPSAGLLGRCMASASEWCVWIMNSSSLSPWTCTQLGEWIDGLVGGWVGR